MPVAVYFANNVVAFWNTHKNNSNYFHQQRNPNLIKGVYQVLGMYLVSDKTFKNKIWNTIQTDNFAKGLSHESWETVEKWYMRIIFQILFLNVSSDTKYIPCTW